MKWCDWLYDFVGMFDRCPHKNASLMVGLRVIVKTPIFLESTGLELPISRPPQVFFKFLKSYRNYKNTIWFWPPFQPTQFVRILCSSMGRAIDTLGVSCYVTPQIFRIQSFLAVSQSANDKIRIGLTKSTCTKAICNTIDDNVSFAFTMIVNCWS